MTRDDVLAALARAPAPVPEVPGSALRRAAVLVPLVDRDDGITVILGQRSGSLERHAGEVSLPGGRIEDGEDEVTAALREAREEVGLDPARVEVVCRLDTHRAGSGYAIAPHVGLVTPPVDLVPDGVEIEEVFEVPLAFLLDPASHARESMPGAPGRRYSVFRHGSRCIWGATATMLVNLVEVLRRER